MADFFKEFCFNVFFPDTSIRDQVLSNFKKLQRRTKSLRLGVEVLGIEAQSVDLDGKPAIQFSDEEGYPETDVLTGFLRDQLEHFKLDDVVGLEWAGRTVPAEPDGFCGGAIAISRHGILAETSSDCLHRAKKGLARKHKDARKGRPRE